MTDAHQRVIRYLRISVTDRCNLRCRYCMPPEGVPDLRHEDILRYEELLRCARVAVTLGIRKVRITGGEPLVRKGLVPFIGHLAEIRGIDDLALTTNGTLLREYAPALKAAGLRRVNISLDTLQRDRYSHITRRDALPAVLDGIAAAREAGLRPIKINVVVMRGVNDDEILDFARLTLNDPLIVRFIELMPMGQGEWNGSGDFLSGEEVLTRLNASFSLREAAENLDPASANRLYRLDGATGQVGIITPLSHHFCRLCNRLRITPDGCLRTCLFSETETDLKPVLRGGGSDEDLAAVFRRSVRDKPTGHGRVAGVWRKCNSNMSRLGG
ncbi:MAG: GTP 3',8-cyclase MoaA [Acidobacteria bacterium]|nr:GTP 3',8-cyclase MoaA [Acidobacteriota bacterium]